MALSRGRRLGIDVGLARIGVAVSDPDSILATPVETVHVSDGPKNTAAPWGKEITRVLDLAREYDAVAVIVGLPASLAGRHTQSTEMARSFCEQLAAVLPDEVELRTTDERLSTVQATGQLHSAGKNAKKQRSIIDQAAAVAILQSWIDLQRAAPDALS